MFDLNTLEIKTGTRLMQRQTHVSAAGSWNKYFPFFFFPPLEPDDHSMLKGMKGYQLTASDLDFLKKMQEEKLINKLQVLFF